MACSDISMVFRGVAWLPLLMVAELSLGVLFSFLIAYSKNHVSIYLPFISETGATLPEMCLFSFTLIIGSFIGAVVVWYRYLVVSSYLENDRGHRIVNFCVMVLGLVVMAGLAGVAAVPVSALLFAHLAAAGIHFGGGCVYICAQTYLTFRMNEKLQNILVYRLRFVLCILMSVLNLILIILFPVAYFSWLKTNDHPTALKKPSDKLFWEIFISSVLEWLVYFIFLSYITTFALEFSKYKIQSAAKPVSGNGKNSPTLNSM